MNELEAIKQIDLAGLALGMGYERDRKKSSRSVTVLRRGSDKILVKIDDDGHSIYCSARDASDRGSVVDFIMRRERLGYVETIQRLRTKTTYPSHTGLSNSPTKPLKATSEPDRRKASAVWQAARRIVNIQFLVAGRGLNAATMDDPKFKDTFRLARNGDVLFPHHDRQGLCGYERRADGLKAMGTNTARGLWFSNNLKIATVIVICESPIDCMSHCQLYGWDAGYVAIGGTLSTRQRDLLTGLFIKAASRGATVIVGTDNDPAGDAYLEQLQLLSPTKLYRLRPVDKDWNADLLYCLKENS